MRKSSSAKSGRSATGGSRSRSRCSTTSSQPFDAPIRVLLRAEESADSVRANLGLSGPVSAFEIARRLAMVVHFDRHIGLRGFTSTRIKPRQIWVKDGERGVRMERACAHEIGHHHVFDQQVHEDLLERACDRFAACLLLPRSEFAASVRDIGADPPALARVWRYSSLELIARRIAEVAPGVSSAAWLHLTRKWQEGRAPRSLARLELAAVSDSYIRPQGLGVAESRAGIVRVWRTGSFPHSAVSVRQAA